MKNTHYHFLEKRFKQWLELEGYQPLTVKSYGESLVSFFNFLESQHVFSIEKVEQKHFTSFKNYLLIRNHKRTNKSGIKSVTINGIIKGVNCFVRHLNKVSSTFSLDLYENYLPVDTKEKLVLSKDEIMKLYNATFDVYPMGSIEMGQRDRVMLGIFYGCGLRLNEGRNINVSDIDFVNKKILVRFGKGKKQRYVPIPNQHLFDIQTYIQQGRDWFKYHHATTAPRYRPKEKEISRGHEDALFLNIQGKRMKSFSQRLEFLRNRTGIDKRIGTHTLRHSVATHLLQSGWKLEDVSKLLGHASIDSTQIYTHLVEQLTDSDYEK